MNELQDAIGYRFNDESLLLEALTHSSYANEQHKKGLNHNERLEFLGDAVLSIAVSDYIFKNCPEFPEGQLTKLRAYLVCEKALYGFAKQINLGKYIRFSHGEIRNGGNKKPSILADAFEAVIAAIYLDGGFENAFKFIYRFVVPEIKNYGSHSQNDYKTRLQEIIQQNSHGKISYEIVDSYGPDHDKHFKVELRIDNNVAGRGGGKSKKEAEQNAAREALELMGY